MDYLSEFWSFHILKCGLQSMVRVGTSFHRSLRVNDMALSLLLIGTSKPAIVRRLLVSICSLFSSCASACGIITALFNWTH